MIDDNQIYVVVDIETDGPVPGLYSMLSLGAVATTGEKEVDSFYATLLPLENAVQDPETMAWWKSQPDAWVEATANAQPAEVVLDSFIKWVNSLEKKPLFVAHPVAFDYTFVSWYSWKFMGINPFTDERGAPMGLDLSSFIAGRFGFSYKNATRTRLPEEQRKDMPIHSHNALDDARGFGVILRNVLRSN